MEFMHGCTSGNVSRSGCGYIFCVGMYRACSTWQYEVVGHLVERYLGGGRLGFIEGIYLEEIPDCGLPADRLKVLKAHDVYPVFTRTLDAGKALPIYAYRDLRDVIFSWMHKAAFTFEQAIEEGFLAKVLANDAYWRSRPNVFSQRYEDVVADQRRAVLELTTCLGLDLPADEITRLAADYSWDANLARTHEVKRKAEESGLDLADRAHRFEHDPHTLLHWNHLREGHRQGWHELATPAQRRVLGDLCGDWLIANGYESDTAWVTDEPPSPGIVRRDRAETSAYRGISRVWSKIARTLSRASRDPAGPG